MAMAIAAGQCYRVMAIAADPDIKKGPSRGRFDERAMAIAAGSDLTGSQGTVGEID